MKNASIKRFARLLAITALAAVSSARADVYCNGVVQQHLVYSDGTLMIIAPWSGQWVFLCNMQAPWKGVSTEACFSWFGLISSAKVHNKSVGIYYVTDTTCTTAVYGNAPAPLYVRMEQ